MSQIITLLWEDLKRDPEHKDRRRTGWGTKTQIGLIASVQRAVEEDHPANSYTELALMLLAATTLENARMYVIDQYATLNSRTVLTEELNARYTALSDALRELASAAAKVENFTATYVGRFAR